MRTRRLIALPVIVISGLSLLAAILLMNPNKYGRLERMRSNSLRLFSPRSQVTLSDRFVGALHQTTPREYYLREWEKEQKKLVASGLLTETRIAIPDRFPDTRSSYDIYEALRKVESETGAHWWATIDLTNRVIALSCRPAHVAFFTSALRNE